MAVYLFFISGLTSIEKTFFEPEFLPQLHLFYFEEYIFDNLLPKVIALSRFFAEDIITIYKLEELAKFHQKNPAICLKEALESLYAIYNFNFGLCSLVLFSYVSIIFPTICVYCAAITLSWTWFLYPLEYLNVTNLRKLVNRDDPRTYSQLIFYDSYIFLKNLLLDYNEFFFLEFKFFKNLNFFKANFIFNFKQFFKNKNKKNFLIFITHIYNMKNLIHDLAFDILLIKKYLLKLYNKYYTKVIKYTCASTDIESINFSSLEAVQTILYFTYYIAFIPPTGVILLELYLNSSYSNEINSFFFDCFPIFFFFFLTLLFYLYYVSQGSAYLVYLSIKLKLFVCYTFLYTLFLNIQKICRYLKKNLVTNFNINVILKDSYDLINKFIQPVLEIHKKDTLFDIDNVIMYTIAIPGFYIRDFFIAKVLTTDVLSEVTNDLGSFMNRTRLGPLGFFYPRVIEKLGESFTYRAYIFFRRGRLYKKDRIEEKKVTYLIENGWFIQKNSLLSILEVFFINYRVKLNLYIDFKDDLEDAFITMNKNYFKFLFKNFTNIKDAFAKIQKSKTYKAYSYKKDPEGLEAFIYFGNRIPILIEMYCGYHILSLTSSLEIILNELLHFDTKKFNANLKLKNKEKELKKKHEEIKKKQGNYIDYDLFTTLENLSISEKKTKNLPVNDKILRCIQYQSFLYIDDDSLGIFPNKKQDNNVTLNKEFLITIADKIIQFFSIDLGENDYESIKKKRLEKFEYYTNFKFLPILKKKIKNITYAYDTQYKYKKPYKIPFLKSDYNVLLNIALFFNNLPKNNINNKNHLSMDVDFLDDGTMIAYFITPETTAFFKDLEKKKKLKIDRQYYHIILFFTSLGVIFFSSYITEPVVVLDGVGTVIDWDIYVNTW